MNPSLVDVYHSPAAPGEHVLKGKTIVKLTIPGDQSLTLHISGVYSKARILELLSRFTSHATQGTLTPCPSQNPSEPASAPDSQPLLLPVEPDAPAVTPSSSPRKKASPRTPPSRRTRRTSTASSSPSTVTPARKPSRSSASVKRPSRKSKPA